MVVCTASNAAYGQGLDFLKFNGTMVAVGIPEGDVQPIANADPAKFVVQQLSVVGSAVGNRKEAIETMEMAARGIVKTHFKVEKMEALNDVFKAMDEGKLQGRVVLDLSG